MRKSLKLEDLEVYKIAIEIGELVWSIVIKWEYFEKKTLGTQFVEASLKKIVDKKFRVLLSLIHV